MTCVCVYLPNSHGLCALKISLSWHSRAIKEVYLTQNRKITKKQKQNHVLKCSKNKKATHGHNQRRQLKALNPLRHLALFLEPACQCEAIHSSAPTRGTASLTWPDESPGPGSFSRFHTLLWYSPCLWGRPQPSPLCPTNPHPDPHKTRIETHSTTSDNNSCMLTLPLSHTSLLTPSCTDAYAQEDMWAVWCQCDRIV